MFCRFGVGLALWASALGAQSLEFRSSTPITAAHELAGGFSALEVTVADHALTVSDRGRFFDLHMVRNERGEIESVEATPADIAMSTRDTEGLAIQGDRVFASFEGPAVVREIGRSILPPHPDFRSMHNNGALEALAIDPTGRLVTLAERGSGSTMPLYRFAEGAWAIVAQVPRRDGFSPVGADFGPEGRLYMLERQFTLIGFRSRIRRFNLEAPDLAEAVLWTSYALQHDNLEGISVWTDPAGDVRLTLVSDDNFQPFQRSQVVEYILID